MNINVEYQPNCRAVIHLHTSPEEVRKHRDQITQYYSSRAKLPGYRPGKVPKAVVLKRFGDEIGEELDRQLASIGLQEAVKNEGLEVLRILEVKDPLHHANDQSFSCSIEVSLAPKFELPEYKGIPVKLPTIQVNDADIDQELLQLRQRYQTYEDVERPVAMGDVAVISFTAKLDGQPMTEAMPDAPDHLKELADQWFLLADEDDFLPGFYAGLNGIEKDGTRSISVTLPADFGFEPLQNRTLELDVVCSGVKERRIPELDEAFAQKIGGSETTLESLRLEVAEALRIKREEARDISKTNQVLEHLATKIEFELPPDVVNRAAQRRTNELAQRALRQGVPEAELLEQQELILNNATQQARQDVKISFILGEVARAENLTVPDVQIQMALAQMAERIQTPVKKFLIEARKRNVIESLHEDLLLQNAIEFLKDQAIVEEIDFQVASNE